MLFDRDGKLVAVLYRKFRCQVQWEWQILWPPNIPYTWGQFQGFPIKVFTLTDILKIGKTFAQVTPIHRLDARYTLYQHIRKILNWVNRCTCRANLEDPQFFQFPLPINLVYRENSRLWMTLSFYAASFRASDRPAWPIGRYLES